MLYYLFQRINMHWSLEVGLGRGKVIIKFMLGEDQVVYISNMVASLAKTHDVIAKLI